MAANNIGLSMGALLKQSTTALVADDANSATTKL
jgi:hypothetical protein